MICVNNNALGGETVFLDSKILSILDKKTPDLLDFLLNQPIKHERSGRNSNVFLRKIMMMYLLIGIITY